MMIDDADAEMGVAMLKAARLADEGKRKTEFIRREGQALNSKAASVVPPNLVFSQIKRMNQIQRESPPPRP